MTKETFDLDMPEWIQRRASSIDLKSGLFGMKLHIEFNDGVDDAGD